MKREVIKLLKLKPGYYTEDRYNLVKSIMEIKIKQDSWLKNYLSLDPINKAEWIADHIILLIKNNLI